jgi:hypothetical protein
MSILKKRIVSFSTAVIMLAYAFSGLPAVVLKADAAAVYDLIIDYVRVNSANCRDILGNGVFRYEPSTQTLIINGDYGDKGTTLINSSIEGLTVNVIEDSDLKGFFYFYDDTTITGYGKLTLDTYNTYYAISVYNDASLDITDANINIRGGYAIAGYEEGEKGLYVTNSFLTAHGEEAAIQGFDYVSLIKCIMTNPSDGLYGTGGVFNSDMTYANDVRIIPAYDLWIDGTQATADNCDDILGNGFFYYDPDHRVLGISGSIEHDSDKELIYSMVPDFTIDIVNDIDMSGYIVLHGDTAIMGEGKFTISATDQYYKTCIFNERCKLTFDNASISAFGNVAIGSPNGTIEVINSDITATGTEQAFAFKDGGFSLTDSMITKPKSAVVGTDTIYNSSSEKATVVQINKAKKTGYKLGDVNGDGLINVTDITLTAAHVKGKKLLNSERLERADVNNSGSVNISDITLIAAHVKGKRLLK